MQKAEEKGKKKLMKLAKLMSSADPAQKSKLQRKLDKQLVKLAMADSSASDKEHGNTPSSPSVAPKLPIYRTPISAPRPAAKISAAVLSSTPEEKLRRENRLQRFQVLCNISYEYL
jgi:hypothetical protein